MLCFLIVSKSIKLRFFLAFLFICIRFSFSFVAENRFICISGPVIVGQSGEIKFQTIYPTHVKISQGKWTRKTKSTCTDLASLKEVSIGNSPDKPMVQNVTITNVQEKGEYQLCLGDMESNKINVFIDGMNICFK